MSLTNTTTENVMPNKLAQAIANPLFPVLDSALRTGRHITNEELDNYEYLAFYQDELELFYQRYNVELIRAPEGFFYLRPRSTTLISRSVLSELDMMIGKILCYLYLSPERLANEGIFTVADLNEELMALADESKLLRYVNQRSTGSDLDRQKLQEKVRASLNRLRRLGMLTFMSSDNQKFRISEAVFRFGADVRSGDDPIAAQLKMIRDGEAMAVEQKLSLNDESEESNEEDELQRSEDEQE